MYVRRSLHRHVALPAEHGAWAFLLLPLVVGLAAGGRWSVVSVYLIVAAVSAFLIRQPITLAIKASSGRRGRDVLPAARFWILVYGAVAALHVTGLVLRGFGYVLWLAIPGIPVFAWYLMLVSRREERRQWSVEVLAAGALALSAPAAYWIGRGGPEPDGWLLWVLTWAQSSASIVHAYMRLAQRTLDRPPDLRGRWRMGRTALVVTSFHLAAVVVLGVEGVVSGWLFVPYAVQWAETLWGVARPAVGLKPKSIGYRQLAVTAIFTFLFVLLWDR